MRGIHIYDRKSLRRANLGNKRITRGIFSLHPSFLTLVIDRLFVGKQWLGCFHPVFSALDNSFSSFLISLSLYFFTHQLRLSLMSLKDILHLPLILTSVSVSLYFPLSHHLYSLSSWPLLSLTRFKLNANQPLHLFPSDIGHLSLSAFHLNCLTVPHPLTIPCIWQIPVLYQSKKYTCELLMHYRPFSVVGWSLLMNIFRTVAVHPLYFS